MCFLIHNWTKWSRLTPTYNSGHKQQWRECKDCGKASFRTLRWDTQSNCKAVNDVLAELEKNKD